MGDEIKEILKVLVENRNLFVNDKKEAFNKAIEKGRSIGYFEESYNINKFRSNFWKYRIKTYNREVKNLGGDSSKLKGYHAIVHEILHGKHVLHAVTKSSIPSRQNLADELKKKEIFKLKLEIKRLKLYNHSLLLKARRKEIELGLGPSKFTRHISNQNFSDDSD